MGETTWTAYGSTTTALSTELNSLADGSESADSSAIDNTSNLDMFMDLEIDLASLTPTGVPYVLIRVKTSVDGTQYDDGDGSPKYSLAVSTGSGVKIGTIRGIPIPPANFKLSLQNETNVALAASGSTVKYRTYSPTTA